MILTRIVAGCESLMDARPRIRTVRPEWPLPPAGSVGGCPSPSGVVFTTNWASVPTCATFNPVPEARQRLAASWRAALEASVSGLSLAFCPWLVFARAVLRALRDRCARCVRARRVDAFVLAPVRSDATPSTSVPLGSTADDAAGDASSFIPSALWTVLSASASLVCSFGFLALSLSFFPFSLRWRSSSAARSASSCRRFSSFMSLTRYGRTNPP